MDDQFVDQFGFAILIPHVIEFLKRSRFFPWLSTDTPGLNRIAGIVCAWAAASGIEVAHEGWTLESGGQIVITMPMLSVLLHSVLRSCWQWVMQQAYYDLRIKGATGVPQPNPTEGGK